MLLKPAWGFVVNPKHIFFLAGDVHHHPIIDGLLLDVPDDLVISFFAIELGAGKGPELGEIEFVALTFVIEGGKQLSIKGDEADLRSTATDIEDAVLKAFTG